MRITGLHHVTAICGDAERSVAFYRDVLGLALVADDENPDDAGARRLVFGDADGTPGTLVTLLEYPEAGPGRPGAGTTHHFALAVDSAAELTAWRDYLRGRGVPCTEIFERGGFSSIYLRDPDEHIVEIASR
jgi:catechol 2,3-dioxygenase-like lactoylglutathione lyase family enzyme